MRLPRSIKALGSLIAVVGCAPSDWSELSGGAREEIGLGAPRQLSPISVSFVATARPRFRWALGASMTGAVVELCRTRACASPRTFAVEGSEIVVPEDLEPGVWFWRLRGRSQGKVSREASAIWEIVVRGRAQRGESDAPTGAMVDLNGDGLPDLVALGDLATQPSPPNVEVDPASLQSGLMIYLAQPDGTYADFSDGVLMDDLAPDSASIAGGSDLDGDGFADLAYANLIFDRPSSAPERRRAIGLYFGGEKARLRELALPTGASASLGVAGDTNGDGYGDLFVGLPDQAFAALGEGARPGASLVAFWWHTPSGDGGPALLGAFDMNADGISDVVAASSTPGTLAILAPGSYTNAKEAAKVVEIRPPMKTAGLARRFTSGDFDGDGVPDLAYVLDAGDATLVCITRGDRDAVLDASPLCVGPAPGEKSLGTSLTAADLEGDGRDELLVSVEVNGELEIRALGLTEHGIEAVPGGPIGPKGAGAALTTLWPGRPGKARWAAATVDRQAILVFEGTAVRQRILPPNDIARGFGRVLR